MTQQNTADEQPTWVCGACGHRYGHWYQGIIAPSILSENRQLPPADYHLSMCDVCRRRDVQVTGPSNFGYLINEWGMSRRPVKRIGCDKNL